MKLSILPRELKAGIQLLTQENSIKKLHRSGRKGQTLCPAAHWHGEGKQNGIINSLHTTVLGHSGAPLGQAAGLHPTCTSILPACGLLKCSEVLGLKRGFYPVLAGEWV